VSYVGWVSRGRFSVIRNASRRTGYVLPSPALCIRRAHVSSALGSRHINRFTRICSRSSRTMPTPPRPESIVGPILPAASLPSLTPRPLTAKGIPLSMAGYKWTGTLRPKYPLSAKRQVPAHIPRPDYADDRESPSSFLVVMWERADCVGSEGRVHARDERVEQVEEFECARGRGDAGSLQGAFTSRLHHPLLLLILVPCPLSPCPFHA
jgi:methionyl aminopeptidase